MPDIRFGPPANVGEPVLAQTVVVGEDVVARLVTELSETRAALARAEARTAGLMELGAPTYGHPISPRICPCLIENHEDCHYCDAPMLGPSREVLGPHRETCEWQAFAAGQRAGGEGETDA